MASYPSATATVASRKSFSVEDILSRPSFVSAPSPSVTSFRGSSPFDQSAFHGHHHHQQLSRVQCGPAAATTAAATMAAISQYHHQNPADYRHYGFAHFLNQTAFLQRGHHSTTDSGLSGAGTSPSLSPSPSSSSHPFVGITSPDGVTYSWVSPPKALPRKRTVFSRTQRNQLETKFQNQKYISKPDRIKFARDLGLKDSQVKVWFINRRTKWRNDREKRLNKAAPKSADIKNAVDIITSTKAGEPSPGEESSMETLPGIKSQ